jgi:hypothetical protein
VASESLDSVSLHWLESSHFYLAVTLAGVIYYAFEAVGNVIGDPVGSALGANQRGDISHNDHAESQVNGKGGCTRPFLSAAIGAGVGIYSVHSFLRVR